MTPTVALPSRERRTLSPRVSYALVALIVGLALYAAGVPSPLYGKWLSRASQTA
jgi:hypothetical protein